MTAKSNSTGPRKQLWHAVSFVGRSAACVWSTFANFLDSPSMARFYEPLGLSDRGHMKALDMVNARCTYRRYIDNCQRLGTRHGPWNRALAKWIETF